MGIMLIQSERSAGIVCKRHFRTIAPNFNYLKPGDIALSRMLKTQGMIQTGSAFDSHVNCWTRAVILAILGILAWSGLAADVLPRSQWDDGLLEAELHNVNIKPKRLRAAWQQISSRYLLRSNFYMDSDSDSDPTVFAFQKETATGKEVFEAFLAAYPAYTMTQDPRTAVIWLHPKSVPYNRILSQEIKIGHAAFQTPMFACVYIPLVRMLSPSVGPLVRNFGSSRSTLSYVVDFPSGLFSVRDVLNICCVADPTMAFGIVARSGGRLGLQPVNIYDGNPLDPPRAGLVRFWKSEIGEPKTGMPSLVEIVSALSESNPRKRWASRIYLMGNLENYNILDLVAKCDDPKKAIWTGLAIKYIDRRGGGDEPFLILNFPELMPAFTNDLPHLDPGLALLASMELAREQKNASLMDVVAGHKFSTAEMDVIKPDVYRIARESKFVRDKLLSMKLDAPALSSEILTELGRTNLFELVPEGKK
jgi:hypothetical protein